MSADQARAAVAAAMERAGHTKENLAQGQGAPNPLTKHTAPREAGAAFSLTREGGLVLIEPLTPIAENWLHSRMSDEAIWVAKRLVVEMRYIPDLVDAIIDAGFLFERDAYPN